MKKLYVGNLSYDATDDSLSSHFSAHGKVASVKIIRDKFDGSSKGFGFIEFENDDEADSAISALDGSDFMGRSLKVSEARAREDNDRRGGGGGRRPGGPRRNNQQGGNKGGGSGRW